MRCWKNCKKLVRINTVCLKTIIFSFHIHFNWVISDEIDRKRRYNIEQESYNMNKVQIKSADKLIRRPNVWLDILDKHHACTICIGNSMVSSSIWEKHCISFFWHCISLKLYCSQPIRIEKFLPVYYVSNCPMLDHYYTFQTPYSTFLHIMY